MKITHVLKGLFAVGTGLGLIHAGLTHEAAEAGLGAVPGAIPAGQKRLAPGQVRSRVYVVRNLTERVSHIIAQIRKGKLNPGVREYTGRLLSRKDKNGAWVTPEKDWPAEVVTIFRAVRMGVRYTHDPHGVDQFTAAARTLQWGVGDCDDYVVVLGSMLQSVGYPVRLRTVLTKQGYQQALRERKPIPEADHIYLLTRVPPMGAGGVWYPLDASVDKPAGWEVPRELIVKLRDFEVPV